MSVMSAPSIRWDRTAKKVHADPAATVGLNRSAWERLGASFSESDDGNGETPGLATATVRTARGALRIGVLDYGEESTYVLVPGDERTLLANTGAVLLALQDGEALRIEDDLLDIAGSDRTPTLEERVAELERVATQGRESGGSVRVPVTAEYPRPRSRAEAGSRRGKINWFADQVGFVTFDEDAPDVLVRIGTPDPRGLRLSKGTSVDFEVGDTGEIELVIRPGSARARPVRTQRPSRRTTSD
jgi:cold shock CspA family protein